MIPGSGQIQQATGNSCRDKDMQGYIPGALSRVEDSAVGWFSRRLGGAPRGRRCGPGVPGCGLGVGGSELGPPNERSKQIFINV